MFFFQKIKFCFNYFYLCTFRFGFLTGSGDEAELLELELGDLFLAFFDTFFKDALDGKGDG